MASDGAVEGTRTYPITVLGDADAGEILTLQRAACVTEAQAHRDVNLPPLTQTFEELRAELSDPDVTALGVRERGRLIAAVRLRRTGTSVELGRLNVVPDRQGQGLGTFLLRICESVFPDAAEITLFTGEHSVANMRLYRRVGYVETGRTDLGDYSLAHFVKTLAQRDGPGA